MTHVRYVFALTVLSAGVLAPTGASAAVVFTEVMYDVPGTDTGREWIEVQNTGSDTVDLSGWKLFEANTNHALTLSQGAGIAPVGFAVIADTPSKFLTDWPTFSGPVFDSSFSLSNSGEALVLRDDSGADVASLTYDPTIGAAGDGNTLQWNGSSWVAALATPGSAYVSGGSTEDDAPPASDDSDTGSTTDDSQTTTATGGSAPLPKKIFADAGPDRTLFVGADYSFTATAIGLTGDPLEGARYVWNFDDGGSAEGSAVSYRYLYPGTYHLVLDVSSGRYATTDRATITVVPAQISIPSVTDTFVSIQNKSTVELDLGGWMLFADGKSFVFPQHTIVTAGETVIVSNERTGLAPSSPKALSLLYPNGAFAASYDVPLIAQRIPASAQAPESTTTPPVSAAAPKDTPAKKVSASVSKPKTTATSSQAAAALLAEQGAGGSGNFMLWIGALGLLVLGAVGGTFFFQGKGGEKYSVTD